MTKKGSEVSEQRFVWLLNQRGFAFWREDALEEKIKVCTKRPDFYVETPGYGPFIAEVESFEKSGPVKSIEARVMASDPEQIFRRIRTAVQHAAKQLRPYKDLNIPMIVILDNWRRVGLPSNVTDLRNALFGTLEVRKRFDPTGTITDPPRWYHGKNYRLNAIQGNYISAVAWNLPKVRYDDDPMNLARPMYLRMVHNHFAVVPFPMEMFNNGNDEHWGYKESRWIKFN